MGQNQIKDPETWVDEYGDALFRYALFRIQDGSVAEDQVQETFLAALRGKDNFAGRSSLRTWLFGILKHKIIDSLRKKHRERPTEDIGELSRELDQQFETNGHWKMGPSSWEGNPDDAYQQQEFWGVFKECLSKLPPKPCS